MKLFTIIILVFLVGCDVENENACDPFNTLVVSPERDQIQKLDCCDGEITEVGFVDLAKNPTYTINKNNCGTCGNVCDGECVCITNSKLQYVDCQCE